MLCIRLSVNLSIRKRKKDIIECDVPGRFCIGAIAAMMLSAPFSKPDAPKPATALARMRNPELGATPHKKDPNSNTPRNARNVYYAMC